jgi:hypothetical protein
LLNKNGIPVNAETLIKEYQGTSHPFDYEYGICQFEYRTSPVAMTDLVFHRWDFHIF